LQVVINNKDMNLKTKLRIRRKNEIRVIKFLYSTYEEIGLVSKKNGVFSSNPLFIRAKLDFKSKENTIIHLEDLSIAAKVTYPKEKNPYYKFKYDIKWKKEF